MKSIDELDRRFYPDPLDEHRTFDDMIARRLTSDAAVLDAGAGRGSMFPYNHRSRVRHLVGVDVDVAVGENPNVDHAIVADLVALPFRDNVFDVVFSKFVFEHLDDPSAVMREFRRILKPRGYVLIHTPSRWHYVSVVAALTPTALHRWYRSRLGWAHGGTFRTRYRANSEKTIVRIAARNGFAVERLVFLEGKPFYLTIHPLAYRIGIAYERLVSRSSTLARFRANILVELRAKQTAVRARP